MRITILDGPVRQNIELFLEILRRVKQRRTLTSDKLFKAWVNRETGQFFASELAPESSILGKKDWKPIEICYDYNPQKGEIYFQIEEIDGIKGTFQCDDLTKEAYAIMRETLKTLNVISRHLTGPSDLETKMGVIIKLQVEDVEKHSDRNIIIDTWHAVDRFEAETLLWDKPPGTYFFRKDPYALVLEDQLKHQHEQEVKCVTLSYSQPDKKFSDLTLVHFQGAWLIYDDDPSLRGVKFSELSSLLEQMKGFLKYPLYHD
jgi:hypothetical protein